MPVDIYHFDPAGDLITPFHELYYGWRQPLFTHVVGKVPPCNFDLAQDICQQVWMEVWRSVGDGTNRTISPGLLVYRADSRIKDHRRRSARMAQFDPEQHDVVSSHTSFEQRIDLDRAVAAIPVAEARTIKHLRAGLTQDEIAAVERMSTRTVRRKVTTTISHLRGRLAPAK
jgi:RNA polymerase sigma factor (sigma-70 family)